MKSNRNHALILAAIHHFSGSCPSSYCTGPCQLISQHHSLCLQLSASFLSRLQDNDRCSKWLMSTSARICLCAIHPSTHPSIHPSIDASTHLLNMCLPLESGTYSTQKLLYELLFCCTLLAFGGCAEHDIRSSCTRAF